MTGTDRKAGAAGWRWYKRRVWRRLTTKVIVIAIRILNVDVSETCSFLNRKIKLVFARSLALAGVGREALS